MKMLKIERRASRSHNDVVLLAETSQMPHLISKIPFGYIS
jgi:hypothetical protein